MMKFFSIFVVIVYAFLEFDQASSFEPLLVLKSFWSSGGIKLPYKATESENGEISYPEIDPKENNYLYLCPPHTQDQKKAIGINSQWYSPDQYCLMEKQGYLRCSSRVQPLFTNRKNRNAASKDCGTSSNHSLYHFGFNYCTDAEDIVGSLTMVESQLIPVYDICFNAQKGRPFWTKHQIQTGFMFKGTSFSSQQLENDSDFSTDAFGENFNFKKQAKMYKKQGSDSSYEMIPQRFVPHEDLALRLWKQTTSHYANTDSLWKELLPLMQTINYGIRKAAIKVNLETNNEDRNSGHNLDIYTTTYSHESFWKGVAHSIAETLRLRKKQFGWNIWCKFVHYRIANQGILIFLHNLPENPPVEMNPAIDNSNVEQSGQETKNVEDGDLLSENQLVGSETKPSSLVKGSEKEKSKTDELLKDKECQKTVQCEFEKWFANQPEQNLPRDFFKYAYCCEATKNKVEELFGAGVEVKEDIMLLNINDIILERV